MVQPVLLLSNPKGRRKARKSTAGKRRKNPSAKQRANWARFAAMARGRARAARSGSAPKRRRARRSNPIVHTYRAAARKRRRNPVVAHRRRARRSNPIMGGNLFSLRSYIGPIKDAAVMGLGAVAMDVGYGYVSRYLPANLQTTPGSVNLGTAVKAILTVAAGLLLAKPTRGLSKKAAMGSLVVQSRDVAMALLPASMGGVAGLGWPTAARVVPMSARANSYTSPPQQRQVMGQFVTGRTPLLSNGMGQFVTGPTPLLSRGVKRGAPRR